LPNLQERVAEALRAYARRSGRPYVTWGEVLLALRELGYEPDSANPLPGPGGEVRPPIRRGNSDGPRRAAP
jgi:hypothetical protein